MKKGVVALLALVIGVVVSVAPAMAHHSFAAEFDGSKAVTLKGYVTKVEWTNPHVWFYIDVKQPNGAVENWGFEMGPPHGLRSEEHTSELQSQSNLVCRLLLEKNKPTTTRRDRTARAARQADPSSGVPRRRHASCRGRERMASAADRGRRRQDHPRDRGTPPPG